MVICRVTILRAVAAFICAMTCVPGTVGMRSAYADPNVVASKDDALTNDVDGDTLADPGDTITYTITITNIGNTNADDVSFFDTIDINTTLVGGSLKTTPLASPDEYNAVGNVGVSVPAPGVLGNDSDPDGGSLAAVAITGGSSINGGDVNLAADGSFTYSPPPGFEGIDTFTYTIEDTDTNTDTTTVTIAVADMIWFIDGSQATNGDGRLATPFNCLVGAGCFDPAATDSAGDTIFVYEGSYNGGLKLLNDQKLIGDGSSSDLPTVTGLTVPPYSTPLPAFTGVDPVLTGSIHGIRLSLDNTVRGLTIGDCGGTGIIGALLGTVTISETSISGAGGGVKIHDCTIDITLDSLSASSSSEPGISLKNVTGTFGVIPGGGSISATGVPAVDITGTGGGVALDVTFASVSSTGSSTNGINLDTTTGSFTVTGTGPAGSGGTIASILAGSNGAAAGIGVRLNNVTNVSLSSMQLNDFSNFAIRGTNVTNFDLTDTTIDGSNGNSAAFDEGSVSFTDLLGSANFTDNTISGGLEDNLRVVNTVGTLNRLTVNGGTIGLNSAALGNDGIFVESQGSATLNVTVEDVLFLGSRGDLLQTNTIGNSTMDIVILDNTFENSHTNIVSGGGGITLSGGSASSDITVTYDVAGTAFGDQTFRDARGNAITINYLNGAGTVFGTVENNRIGASGEVGSGSDASSGILVGSGGTLDHRVLVNNNEILGIDGFAGIEVIANAQSTLNATVTNNTIDQMSGFVLAGMYLLVGGGASDTSTLCADIRGNTINASGVSFASAVFFDQISGSANHNLPSYAGSPHGEFGSPSTGTASVDLETYLLGRGNSLTAGVIALFDVDASLVQGVTGNGAGCSLPLMATRLPTGVRHLLAASEAKITMDRANAISVVRAEGFAGAKSPGLPGPLLGSTSMSFATSIMAAVLNATAGPADTGAAASVENMELSIGTLPPGKSITITFEVTVNAQLSGGTAQICNQGIVSGDGFAVEPTDDPDVGGIADPTCTPIDETSADLSITKRDSVDPVMAGDPLVYTITVANNGPSDAQNVLVTDTLPAGVTFISTEGCVEDPNGVPTCTLGTIAAGGTANYTIEVLVDPATLGTLSNTASVSSDVADPDISNNTATEDTTVTPVQGACCDGASCAIGGEEDCSALGGTYQGDDTTCDSNPCICGDLDDDGVVDGQDFQIFLAAFGRSFGDGSGLYNPAADFDADDMITFVDYQAWLNCFRAFTGDPDESPSLELRGDYDADSDVDLADYRLFWECMVGSDPGLAFPCSLHFDVDGDDTIGLKDFGVFQRTFAIPMR